MYAFLKLTTAVVALVCSIQAVPLIPHCSGAECSQDISTGTTSVGSITNIVPVTQVVPVTRYQPIVQAYAPIVQSECAPSARSRLLNVVPLTPEPHLHRPDYLRSNPAFFSSANDFNRFLKRRAEVECIPSATQSCEQTLATSTADMGSLVKVEPSTVVLPSTVYQGHVKSQEAKIYAAEAQHTDLKHQNVDMGSNTFIQPVTKVIPHTTYQPSVDQMTTMIHAAPAQDQSLARSSVSLGSTVTIRPVTKVEPLTIFQPKIESLPFIIHDAACETQIVPPEQARVASY
ncbi:hypothetical protein BC939DRAFT_498306 [Gamsiella multidivaricata]|uniref:uncharacterized protein n=1 Tax=Gamsiella multidivaricata TaxID=101098 RepID=UPI00221EEE67|nr:uncharacterized protein BC939DRAFT_498306 [Gamsiella multidivaricata]KAG0370602.1 hypothetical protein BGZ54_005507 [Gamsiella multidivaricata]KAI7832212.1 hypothetical protein BC939DRAFT_498306 [Gamsiella multidivaricata]